MTSGAPIRSRTNASSSFLQGYEKPVLNQPGQGFVAQRNRWRHAAQLLLDQADVAAVSHQVHLALFYDTQLDFGTRPPPQARGRKRQ
jgi:hypothetical protein